MAFVDPEPPAAQAIGVIKAGNQPAQALRPVGFYEATEVKILSVGSFMEGMSKHRLRSEKLCSAGLRTGVRLPSGPP